MPWPIKCSPNFPYSGWPILTLLISFTFLRVCCYLMSGNDRMQRILIRSECSLLWIRRCHGTATRAKLGRQPAYSSNRSSVGTRHFIMSNRLCTAMLHNALSIRKKTILWMDVNPDARDKNHATGACPFFIHVFINETEASNPLTDTNI